MRWKITSDWNSHRPVLQYAVESIPHDFFFEFGIGFGSTPQLAAWYNNPNLNVNNVEFYSYETNQDWVEKMADEKYRAGVRGDSHINKLHCILKVDDYLKMGIHPNAIVFIDCAPGELRKELIAKYANDAKVIIVHDTEDGANYVYGMKDVLNTFKYRFDYKPEGMPATTAVSNQIDVSQWQL